MEIIRVKNLKSHHFPNVVSQILIGMAGFALSIVFLSAFAMSNPGSQGIGTVLFTAFFGFFLISISPIVLLFDSVCYLKEIRFVEEGISGVHIFGWKVFLPYSALTRCKVGRTNPEHGFGNPCIVMRFKAFPFRAVFNMKGFEERQAQILGMAINHKAERFNRSQKRQSTTARKAKSFPS